MNQPKPITMGKLARRNVRWHPARFVATMLAIVVGTGFLAGALVLKDSLASTLENNATTQLQGVDAAISPIAGTGTGTGTSETTGTTPGTTAPSSPIVPGTAAHTTGTSGNSGTTLPATGATPRVAGRRGRGVEQRDLLPASLLTTVQSVSGVGAAAGNLSGPLRILSPPDVTAGAASSDPFGNQQFQLGSLYVAPSQLNQFSLDSGAWPTAAGQVAVDSDSARNHNISIGTPVSLATTTGPQQATVVGIVATSSASAAGNGVVIVSAADAFGYLSNGKQEYDSIYVVAADGTSPDTLVANIEAKIGSGYDVQSGDELRDQQAGQAGDVANGIGWGLQGFAYLALFVGIFVIYNTFSIVVAQRTHEFALLRAIGASGKQVSKSVRREALIVGLVSSAIGFGLGVVLFLLLVHFVSAFRLQGLNVRLVINPWSIVQVLILGVLVTFVSSLFPAWRAARTKPIEALREVTFDRSATSNFRAVTGLVFIALGIGFMLLFTITTKFLVLLPGPPLLFLGVLVGGPRLAKTFAGAVEFVLAPFKRITWRIGVENVKRNPKRAASTANALVIGVFLVVFVTSAGGAVRDWAVTRMSAFSGPDFMVVATGTGLPADVPPKVAAVPGVSGSTVVYSNVGSLQRGGQVGATDFSNLGPIGFTVLSGSLAGLNDQQIIVSQVLAQQDGLVVGDRVNVQLQNGRTVPLTVGALTQVQISVTSSQAFMSSKAALAADPAITADQIDVQVDEGQNQQVADGLRALTQSYTSIAVLPGNIFGQIIKALMNALISSVTGLLMVAVVVALFGIINTLILSVTERTREIGLVRATGMTRRQLRSAVRLEAVVVSLLGSLLGILGGLFVAWCVTKPLFADGNGSFPWPVVQMGEILLLGLVLGVVASLAPAWRASRMNVLDAIRAE